MKKLLTAMALMFMLIAPIMAAQTDMPGWDNLSEAQKAALKLEAARQSEAAKKAKASVPVKPEDLTKWIELSKGLGTGFNSFAKELGKTVDELLGTTVGQVGMFLIVWHYIGETFTGYLIGGIWFLFAIPAWMYYLRRWVMNPVWEWHENGKRKSLTYKKSASDGSIFYFTAVLICILGIGFIIMF